MFECNFVLLDKFQVRHADKGQKHKIAIVLAKLVIEFFSDLDVARQSDLVEFEIGEKDIAAGINFI
ncbi:hypothetical protein D3C83_126850 [compost metagenome]